MRRGTFMEPGRRGRNAVRALAAALLLAPGPLAAQSAPATHAYAPAAEAPSDAARTLAERLGGEVRVRELMAAGEERPLARVEVAELPDGGTRLLGWRALTPAPVLRRDIRAAEDLALAEAMARHLPEGSRILAFPGVSRRLAALVAAEFPLAGEAEPLALPQPWASKGAEVAAAEARQWGGAAAAGIPDGPVAEFAGALLAEDRIGAARLKVMAGGGPAFVLVHLEDAFQLGLLRPGRMAMTRRDFAADSFSHDLAGEARRWAQASGQAAWAVDRGPDGRLRGHYLTEATETATLLAQLLPFSTSRLDSVPGLRLVWQNDGYWLYRLGEIGE